MQPSWLSTFQPPSFFARSAAISHIACTDRHGGQHGFPTKYRHLGMKTKLEWLVEMGGHHTLMPSTFSCARSPRSIRRCISSIITGRLRPFTNTLSIQTGHVSMYIQWGWGATCHRAVTVVLSRNKELAGGAYTYLKPGNFCS